MRQYVAVIFICFCQLAIADLGFSSGNEMTSISIAGDVRLTCLSGNDDPARTVAFQCRDTILVPNDSDYFVGPRDMEADQVELTVTRSDGSIRSRQVGYSSARGMSETRFNLWAGSLFQKPLLMLGENKVEFKLSRNGQVVKMGNFDALVRIGGFHQCVASEFYSNTASDCNQPYTYCQRFFREKNYCQ
jgi:hypothetical protein